MNMSTVEASIEINRPVDAVFAFLTNLENQKLQNPGITSISLNGPFAVGTHYITKGQVMGRDFSTETEIVAIEPNKKFSIKTLAPPPASPVTNTYTLEPSGTGTRLTTGMDAVIMGFGMEEMIKSQLKTALEAGNAALKQLIEG
jgi:carbon monoxide dehydrogenase subunit G